MLLSMIEAAKEEIFPSFPAWCADPASAARMVNPEKSHQGVAPQNLALHRGIAWSNSTSALGMRGLGLENRVRSRCTGKERDTESGNDYFEARYFGSSMGRFMTPDPLPWLGWQHPSEESTEEEKEEAHKKFEDWIGNPQNLNMYAYALNNPLRYTDPTGMSGCQAGDKTFSTCTITITYDPKTSQGTLVVTGQNQGDKSPTTLLTTSVVVGGDGHVTPTGTFTATTWEKDHVSTKYGQWADTPYSKTTFGMNAFGPFQLHIKELDSRGIYIHGTMGPSWNPFTGLNSLVSPTSHGCIRMCNRDDVALHNLMPNPAGNKIIIQTAPSQ
jgi:RHS repeat-associated protein